MGTLIQTVYETEAAELRMLGYLGCDVTTWGNHEFDYRSSGLANMLNTAKASGENVPSLVVCNVDWSAMEKAGLTEGQQQIKDAFENYSVKDYVVVQKGDVKIAVFGVFGKDSLDCAPTCELLFEDPIEASKKTVEEIKKNEDMDMIACVSHSGTVEDEDKSEDEILAKSVPDIDLIISGHTHTQLDEPIRHGDTYIVSCGEYGRNLGTISMTQKDDGRWDVDTYELIPVTDEIKADAATQERIDELMETVDTNYLSHFGYTKDQILAENDIEFSSVDDMYNEHEELNLGDIMSDAYVYAVENAADYDGVPVDVAVVPIDRVARDGFPCGVDLRSLVDAARSHVAVRVFASTGRAGRSCSGHWDRSPRHRCSGQGIRARRRRRPFPSPAGRRSARCASCAASDAAARRRRRSRRYP